MRDVDLRGIRNRLPHGSIAKIAEETGLSVQTVSNIFNKGWYPQHRGDVIARAIDIIKSTYPDEQVLEDAEELNLTTSHAFRVPYKRKVSASVNGAGSIGLLGVLALFGIVAAVIYLIKPEWFQSLLSMFKRPVSLTPEEVLAIKVKDSTLGTV